MKPTIDTAQQLPSPPPYSRRLRPRLLAALLVGSAALGAGGAAAQSDVEKPLPNVLLLVDNSGSMEFRAEDNELPECTPGNPGATNEKSRWIDLVEVMTGRFDGFSCFAMDRSSEGFRTEFAIDGQNPYDYNYVNPYHRAISNNCVVGPGVIPGEAGGSVYDWPDRAVNTFAFNAPATVTLVDDPTTHDGCEGFQQSSDGILDVFKEKVRFGLMTFDSHTDASTGVTGEGSMDVTGGMAGLWSYYINELPLSGKPADCASMQTQEVGARNAAAPPWEGRMVTFGAPNASASELNTRNDQIQQVLLASRPYGATPIAGMMHDAREFFWYDESADVVNDDNDFGPFDDPATKAPNCRRSLIILLSDGEPNLDLRPHCEGTEESDIAGVCPFDKPEEIAASLLSPPDLIDQDQRVETAVIGFALSRVTPAGSEEISCAELTEDHCSAAANANNRAVQACCTLNKIAAAGRDADDSGNARTAYFPQNSTELRKAFSEILKDVTINLTTRTSPVFSTAGSAASGGAQQFSSSFVPLVEEPWAGNLTRTRILCIDGEPQAQDVDADAGDDFAANVNSGAGPERKFITYVPEAGNAGRTLRPNLSSDADGLGALEGTQTNPLTASDFVSEIPEGVAEIEAEDCTLSTAALCRDAILGWSVGLSNDEDETRCASPGADCNVFGAIYHATPWLVPGRPNEYLRDESYAAYARAQTTKARPSVMYTGTIDGQLHAFKTAPHNPDPAQEVDSRSNNELWSFMPPAVLPVMKSQYPNTPATLLDGPIQVRDVPSRPVGGQNVFERTQTDAQEGGGDWRTVLLSSFGVGQIDGGYYAVDVTDPDLGDGGPDFLWQLTNDANGDPLFGEGGAGLIATVFLKTSDDDPGKEVAVAILPGGDGGTKSGGAADAGPVMDTEDETYAAAELVNEYTGGEAAKSLTVVRLDTGEVLRSFRTSTLGTTLDASRITVVDIPAPIVGKAAAFPGATGSVADRVFVGDREGRVWRLDVSKSRPSQWTFDVFFDVYFDQTRDKREPIELAPVVSVDGIGRITVNVATGYQRVQTGTEAMLNRVVSLTETLDEDNNFQAKVNWVENLGCNGTCGDDEYIGERVTGPMSLFGSSLYFASSSPATSDADECGIGSSRIWGLNYIVSADELEQAETIDPLNGAAGALPAPDDDDPLLKSTEPEPGVVFGVSIEQQPSCAVLVEDYTGDPYLGSYGEHTSVASINPGSFSLVYQVGGVGGAENNKVATEKVPLEPPNNSVWVDSWAPIFE